jgi:Uma2 family endonuclease
MSEARAMVTTAEEYERIALEDPDGRWELVDGYLRQKPTMTTQHNRVQYRLGVQLTLQLDPAQFEWRLDNSRAARRPRSFYIPDLFVVPVEWVERKLGEPPRLEVYDEPLPLVVEVWSPSTGGYDIDTKIPMYRRRGDQEIWRIHPFEQTLITWRRQPDGSYTETFHTGGTIEPVALPGVVINIDQLFAS